MPLRPKKTALKRSTKVPRRLPTKKATKRPLTRAATPKSRSDRAIADIRSALKEAESKYHDIGRALISLRSPDIWSRYGETTFRGFINAQIMPYTTALRMITVAESYPKAIAAQIGHQRGFQLARLARYDADLKRQNAKPAELWKSNAKLSNGKRVQSMSAREIEGLVAGALLRSAKKKKRAPNDTESEAYDAIQEDWDELLGFDAEFDLDLKTRTIHIVLKLDDVIKELE